MANLTSGAEDIPSDGDVVNVKYIYVRYRL